MRGLGSTNATIAMSRPSAQILVYKYHFLVPFSEIAHARAGADEIQGDLGVSFLY